MDSIQIFIILLIVLIWFLPFKKKNRIIPYGILEKQLLVKIQKNQYLIEEYNFKDSINSYRYYQKVVFDYSNLPDLTDTKYDLYDWSFTYFQFKKFSLRIMRYGNKLQCVKSNLPVTIDKFEADHSDILRFVKKKLPPHGK